MSKEATKKIAIGQCRVSKGDKAEIDNSLKSQQAEILTLAEKLGIKEEQIDWFIEDAPRSSYQERANWKPFEDKINEACNNPDICYFLSYSQERFCRNRRRSSQYKEKLRDNDIEVRFVSGDIEDHNSDGGYWQEGIQELAAEGYSRKVSSDTLRGCKQTAKTRDPETGYVYKNGGTAPFWLMPVKKNIGTDHYGRAVTKTIWDKNTNIYTANYNRKEMSKTMWDWGKYIFLTLRLKQGKSLNEIADFVNEIGLPISRNSKFVRANTLSLQLKNECLYGVSVYNKRSFKGKTKSTLNPEKEWIVEENAMPALITREQFDLLQEISKKKARKVGNTSANTSNSKLLVNIPEKFYCSHCGAKIISSGKHYVCSNYNSYGKKGCGVSSFYIPSDWLDSKIEQEIIKLILNEKTITELYERYTHKYGNKVNIDNDSKVDKSVLIKTLKQKKNEETNLLNAIASGNISGAALEATSNRLNSVSTEIKTIEAQLDSSDRPNQYRILTYNYFKQLCHEGSKLLTHSSLAKKRAFVEKCIASVTLDPVRKAVNVKFNINPFWTSLENPKKTKKLEVSTFDTSSEMVAGAGFEPTTFGL